MAMVQTNQKRLIWISWHLASLLRNQGLEKSRPTTQAVEIRAHACLFKEALFSLQGGLFTVTTNARLPAQTAGLMFWFKRKKLLGSYFFFTALSRS
jgi:hypothetical protein